MILAERIRAFVVLNYVEPARTRGERYVVVVARDVIKRLALKNRSAAVCNALDAEKFARDNCLNLSKRSGPRLGRTVEWVLDVKPTCAIE